MHSRRLAHLLPFAVTAAVFVATVGMVRVFGGEVAPRQAVPPIGPTGAVEPPGNVPELRRHPGPGAVDGPTAFTKFDLSLLVLGALGLIGFGLRVGGLVTATPFGRPLRLGARLAPRPGARAAFVPVVVLGVLLVTATTALAQRQPNGPPYVGNPPDGQTAPPLGTAPYVGTDPVADAGDYAGVYVDALPQITAAASPTVGGVVAAGARSAPRTAGEPATVGTATESADGAVGGMPVTVADVVGLVLLAVAALLVVLVPRWRCP
ncbi:MAG TPA: hypothetical protein VHF24_07890 [Acidimicrobiales bacterium]|nr:hypothetical protein [Acidimicrobiales bacterium]